MAKAGMHIRSIVIQGFKSFPDRSQVDFGSGIAAVVGPNGCGKSNILDAIRWCFGSQSPKELRGASMQDVIFAGTSKRPAAGYAEVSVTFANESRSAPAPFTDVAEIRVTRRVDRTGESEYRLNGARVRLKDVQEFLMDIGYGEYSIVQQGSVGQIIQAKPEDVRVLIEQAGRMTKFRSRREEAQSKMARTEENLERVLDLIQEIERQMNALKRQADKAQRAQEVEMEIATVARQLLARELEEKQTRRSALDREAGEVSDRIQAIRTTISRLEAEQESLHQEQTAADAAFEALLAEQRAAQERRTELERRLSALDNEAAMRQDEIRSATEERRQVSAEMAEISAAIAALDPELAAAREREARLRARTAELELSLREKRAQAENLQARYDELRDEHLEHTRRQVDMRGALHRAEVSLAGLDARIGELRRREAEVTKQHHSESERQSELRGRLDAAVAAAEGFRTRADAARREVQSTGSAVDNAQAQLTNIERQLQDLRIERESLTAALRAGDRGTDLPAGSEEDVISPWSRVSPLPGYEALLETILAERFRAFLVLRREAADTLRASAAAPDCERRLSWLIADGEAPSADPPLGARAVADLLQADTTDLPWIRRLTAGIFVLEEGTLDSESALPAGTWEILWDRQGNSVDRNGVWSAGPLATSGTAHLAARRAALADDILRLEAEIVTRTDNLAREREALTRATAERDALEQMVLESTRQSQALQHQLQLLSASAQRTSEQMTALHAEIEQLTREQTRIAAEYAAVEKALAEVTRTLESVLAEVERTETALAPLAADRDRLDAEVAAARAELDAAHESLLTSERRSAALGQRRAALEDRSARLDEQIRLAGDRLAVIAVERANIQAEAEQVNQISFELAGRVEASQRQHAALRARYVDLERHLRTANQELDVAQQLRARKEQELLDLRHSMTMAIEGYAQRFGVPFAPPDSVDPRSTEELMAEHDRLVERRTRMGMVNPGAPEEYQEVKRRFDELTAQREDLLHSLETLRSSIRRMNQESRERFRGTFEQVNRHFGEIFSKLFRGGRAELRLVDPDDWLESGVEVIAQPPGTNLQRLQLLSGGQSAMTAIALILAIFMTHPSPFCILDEVDAPLDDANIARFNQVLVELNELAQILLVTHNKHTMEIADALYGITMEERGVSKAIAVHLT